MAQIITYTVGQKNILKQAEKDKVNYVVSYQKKAISLETPDIVIVGIKGSVIDLRDYLDAHPHRDNYYVYTNNRL